CGALVSKSPWSTCSVDSGAAAADAVLAPPASLALLREPRHAVAHASPTENAIPTTEYEAGRITAGPLFSPERLGIKS
ncbi:MAG: hypothetical protein ACM3ZE_01495, partial [Myxococcales bacterium]